MALFTRTIRLVPEDADVIAAVKRLAILQDKLFAATIAHARPGMTTRELASHAREQAVRLGADLYFRTVLQFPDDLSIGIGNAAMNAVPNDAVIRQGGIVRLALGLHEDGRAHALQNWSFCMGVPATATRHLLDGVKTAVHEIAQRCHPGMRYSGLAAAFDTISEREGFYLSPEYVGAPIGKRPLAGPLMKAPRGLFERDAELVPGVLLSVFALGHSGKARLAVQDDGWTVDDEKGHLSAIFSHLVEVTPDGPHILSGDHPVVAQAGPREP